MSDKKLDDLWEATWRLLHRGQSDPKSAYSTPVVATVSPEGKPHSRTLVLRKALKDQGQLWCYTDRRSQKAIDLTGERACMSWTFWDRKQKIQLNASGPTTWLDTELATERFRQLPKHSRKSYATLAAPGRPLPAYSDGLPVDWDQREVSETDYASEHFGILCTTLDRMEILQLRREGHRRMLAERREGGEWLFSWIVP
jgi:pyridoxine/pyridoxamine 5'-phosphate oxidase